ncbi:MAG: NAD-glutamate dehydrogenase [Candidatus Nanopelagicales bacterium]
MGFIEGYQWASPRDAAIAALFYRHVDPHDVSGRDEVTMRGCVEALIGAAQVRAPNHALVRATYPTVAEDGWSCGRTVVTVITDDMPFLVDSVTAELNRQGASIHLVVHPIVAVTRDDSGRLLTAESPALGPESEPVLPQMEAVGGLESWMHIELDWRGDTATLAGIEKGVAGILADVRRAVDDWPWMVAEARGLAAQFVAAPPRRLDPDQIGQTIDLLNWLADDHFTFLGYREYRLAGLGGDPGELALVSEPGSGLGLLRSDRAESTSFKDMPPQVRQRAREPRLLILTKANRRSTVHRPVYLDYVGVKIFDRAGQVIGEHRFIGLLSASAYTQSVTEIPVIDRKVRRVREALGFGRATHGGRDLMLFLETFPRDELFAISTDELIAISEAALNLKERRATRLFLRRDDYERFLSCLVYLPRDRYTTDVRLRIQKLLVDQIGGASVEYTARVTESVLARLHMVVRMPRGVALPAVDAEALEARIARAALSWEDLLVVELAAASTEADAHAVLRRYPEGFPEAYRASVSPGDAVSDLAELDLLTGDRPLALSLKPAAAESGAQANARLTLYALSDISLAQVLPVLTSLGAQVVTERLFRLTRTEQGGAAVGAFIYDFGLRATGATSLAQVRRLWEEAFLACWSGRAEIDGFNGLVAAAGLDWRRISVLRAYARYLRQVGSAFSQEYIETAMLANPGIASLLVKVFHARFDPDLPGDRRAQADELRTQIDRQLEDVASLDQDRILRSFLDLIRATLRTNHFQADRPALAIKLFPAHVRDLVHPRPKYEIWVCSPRVEGVHLRFGEVARGGLRWSDRREDFRTEVLGLVKAQAVKNAVIVPVGAKGGFYPKRLPDPAGDREAWLAEGTAAYRVFVGSLLDLTDNLAGSQVVAPARVVRHDGDDTYLVVAADKGTATFSDIANGVAAEYGYWLGDAFASGGSAGYDHKSMGITARGAWESVKSHFRVLGRDIANEPFTAVGIGDMSGDVFGNGMLQSEKLCLVAAFDHRHIFLDPDPDPAAAFAERRRLFGLPRSSWADYSASLLSPGGGVHPRSAKSIRITPQVARALGMAAHEEAMTPNEVLRAILAAPVDLLWNGGIGTYVKASTETHAAVGDRANDAIRVNGADLRVRVVGEGGNLGLTQRGRIEAARAGVALNTDAIDNSAGVDTSDHEVNIKILLDRLVSTGAVDRAERDPLLLSLTDQVAALVLRHNVAQNTLLQFEAQHGAPAVPTVGRLIRSLERTVALDRALEALPSDAELSVITAEGRGLTTPELAVLVAYAKLDLKAALLDSPVPDERFAGAWLRDYFPAVLADRFVDHLAEHPLRRQIIATGIANDMVDRGGITYAMRAAEETGAGPAEIARAFAVTCGIFGLGSLWARIDVEEGRTRTSALNGLRIEVQRLLDRSTRWLLQSRGGTLDVPGEVDRFRATVAALAERIPALLVGVEQERLDRRVADFEDAGAPPALAADVASLLDRFSLLDVVEVSRMTGEDPARVAELYFTLSDRYQVDHFLGRISALPRSDRWSSLARSALRSDLYGALASLTSRVVRATPEGGEPAARVAVWEERHAEGLGRARATLAEIGGQESSDLATLSVALRVMRTLAFQGG